MGRLQKEIKQTKPFGSPEEEAFLSLQRVADQLMRAVTEVLKPAALSPVQYNVLRILRGAGAAGLACREIGDRMVTRDPDVTRLLDRLEERNLLARTRDSRDRRVIVTRITPEGKDALKRLDAVVAEVPRRMLGHLGAVRIKELVRTMELVLEGPGTARSAGALVRTNANK